MQNIKPVSDSTNYGKEITVDAPVFLTKTAREENAMIQLLSQLAKGADSATKGGWICGSGVEELLGICK